MFQKIVSFFLLCALPQFLLAHGSHGDGIMAGLTHPIFGLDHNAAILGVGILGYFIYKKKWYLSIAAFLVTMIIGGMLGIGNEATVMVEKMIALSVVLLGVLIIFRAKVHNYAVLFLLLAFGFFHGFAHGAEMPETTTAFKYILGYSLGTILLGLLGALLGKAMGSIGEDEKYW